MMMMHPYKSRIPVALPRQQDSMPSRLEQLKFDYRQQLKREKEAKLSDLCRQNETIAWQKVKETGKPNMVRDFFQERRQLSDTGFVPDIKQHYSQKRREYGVSNPNSGRPPPYKKNSAGRDKSNPLTPINHNSPINSANNTYTINSPATSAHTGSAKSRQSPVVNHNRQISPAPRPPPFQKKAKMAHPYRRNSRTTPDEDQHMFSDHENKVAPVQYAKVVRAGKHKQKSPVVFSSDDEDDQYAPTVQNDNLSKDNHNNFAKWHLERERRKLQERKRRENAQLNGFHSEPEDRHPPSPKKMSDFEKWQLQQNKEKDDRLKKFRERQRQASETEYGYLRDAGTPHSAGYRSPSKTPGRSARTPAQERDGYGSRSARTNGNLSRTSSRQSDTARSERGATEIEAELKRKEKELMMMIQRQQAELASMKNGQEEAEEQERQEREKRRQRAAEQRERQKRLTEARDRARRRSEVDDSSRQPSFYEEERARSNLSAQSVKSRTKYVPPKLPSAKKKKVPTATLR